LSFVRRFDDGIVGKPTFMDTTMTPHSDNDLTELMGTFASVVILTDRDDEQLDHVRRTATRLAVDHGWDLIVYDRSQETWMDSPHPTGPVATDELSGSDERAHLHRQMQDIEAAGVSVTAWLSTVPSISAIADVVREMHVDAVLIPSDFEQPKLADRLLSGDGATSVARTLADIDPTDGTTLLLITPDGQLVRAVDDSSAST
jgi:hypothetical protein